MADVKFTPGPWRWVGNNLEAPTTYTDVIDAQVSCGRWCEGGTPRLIVSDADRALIAAAPDLFSAAKAVVARWDTPLWKDAPATAEYINQLRAAIRKAERK